MSYQKARFISDRQDEEGYKQARRVWVEETWPAILKQAQARGAVILFADEVCFALWGSLSRDLGAARSATGGQDPGAAQEDEAVWGDRVKAQGVPAEVVQALRPLKGQRFETEGAFLQAVEQCLGAEALGQYRALLLKLGEGAGKFNATTYEAFLRQLALARLSQLKSRSR